MSWIELEGTANARDVGGLPTVDGRVTRPGVLLRSDNLQDLTPADVDRLVRELGLRTVVDLRSTGEVHLEGPTLLTAPPYDLMVRHHQLSLIPEWDGEPDRDEVERAVEQASPGSVTEHRLLTERALPSIDMTPTDDPTDLTHHYVGYLSSAGENVGRALRVLADPGSGPTLVHCAAGKDRTGVVVALTLSLVGVTRAAVVGDYVRSAERAAGILARLQGTSSYGPSLAQTTVDDITPRATSIQGLLDHVDRAYGGPHALAATLGVSEEDVARLGVRLLGSAPSVGGR